MASWQERYEWIVKFFHDGNQAAAAREIGVTKAAISSICTGRSAPSADTLAGTAKAYPNLSTQWLLTGKGAPLVPQSVGEGEAAALLRRVRRLLAVPGGTAS